MTTASRSRVSTSWRALISQLKNAGLVSPVPLRATVVTSSRPLGAWSISRWPRNSACESPVTSTLSGRSGVGWAKLWRTSFFRFGRRIASEPRSSSVPAAVFDLLPEGEVEALAREVQADGARKVVERPAHGQDDVAGGPGLHALAGPDERLGVEQRRDRQRDQRSRRAPGPPAS